MSWTGETTNSARLSGSSSPLSLRPLRLSLDRRVGDARARGEGVECGTGALVGEGDALVERIGDVSRAMMTGRVRVALDPIGLFRLPL
jgi:hypothetical protein